MQIYWKSSKNAARKWGTLHSPIVHVVISNDERVLLMSIL